VGTERLPAFSMMVRKPEDGNPAVAARIRSASAAYTRPVGGLSGLTDDEIEGEEKVSQYRRLLTERQNQDGQPGEGKP